MEKDCIVPTSDVAITFRRRYIAIQIRAFGYPNFVFMTPSRLGVEGR